MSKALSALNPFKRPKVPTPVPPPTTPTMAQALTEGGRGGSSGFTSLISTAGASGLSRKAMTKKRSLIGGG